jgi:Uncharacterized protein conserved in bacteria (DUF2188)
MANSKHVHVVPRGEKWAVIREGNSRASSLHDTQNHAWQTGQGMARSDKGEAFLHGQNGQIRQRNTYGHDPFPPRDKK